MKLRVVWSDFAENQLDQIFDYYLKNTTQQVSQQIVLGILEKASTLSSFPFMGQIEDLLVNRKGIYWYLIYQNYKIIYSIDEQKQLVKIADIFDTRLNPKKIQRS